MITPPPGAEGAEVYNSPISKRFSQQKTPPSQVPFTSSSHLSSAQVAANVGQAENEAPDGSLLKRTASSLADPIKNFYGNKKELFQGYKKNMENMGVGRKGLAFFGLALAGLIACVSKATVFLASAAFGGFVGTLISYKEKETIEKLDREQMIVMSCIINVGVGIGMMKGMILDASLGREVLNPSADVTAVNDDLKAAQMGYALAAGPARLLRGAFLQLFPGDHSKFVIGKPEKIEISDE